jgi:anti-sigma-K factor RskA
MSATIPESIRELAAGYALGALTLDETRQFEAALAEFPELERDVAEFREVNALLAMGGTERPSPAVRDQLLTQVGQTKVVSLRPARSMAWLMPVALAASTVVAVGLGLRVRRLASELDRQTSTLASATAQLARREETLNTLLTAESDLTVLQLTSTGAESPGIQFFWNRRQNRGVLHAFRLPQPAPGKVYQLWLIPRGGTPIPSTTFGSGADGHSLVESFQLPIDGGFEAAAITIEPEGGSQTPTMPIYLIGKVSGP